MSDTVVLITRNGMGTADPALAHKLAGSFLDLLDLEDRLPAVICFYAEGVHLACEDSPVLETLAALAERGVRQLVCGTCLAFYDLEQKRVAGEPSNMREIQAAIWDAHKVITL
jgi:intracellular sulfur oxidation DsrE/DsrF family protein